MEGPLDLEGLRPTWRFEVEAMEELVAGPGVVPLAVAGLEEAVAFVPSTEPKRAESVLVQVGCS